MLKENKENPWIYIDHTRDDLNDQIAHIPMAPDEVDLHFFINTLIGNNQIPATLKCTHVIQSTPLSLICKVRNQEQYVVLKEDLHSWRFHKTEINQNQEPNQCQT